MEARLYRHFMRMRNQLGYAVSILPVNLKDKENSDIRNEASELLSHDEFELAIDVLREAPELPGVLTYGKSREEAVERVQALALRVVADRLEHGEAIPELEHLFAVVP